VNSEDPLEIRVLLVEDSAADVYLVREAMSREGLNFRLDVAEDGEKAIEILDHVDANPQEHAPGLLLLDLNVPRKNGMVVLDRLRQSPRCGGIPVIMISSSDSPWDRRSAFELGVTEYFRKPSYLDQFMLLGKIVRRLVDEPGPVEVADTRSLSGA